jgi:hypothetical protein
VPSNSVRPSGGILECGAPRVREWYQAADVMHRCSCGTLWDQDHNAAINLLAAGIAGGGVPAIPLHTGIRARRRQRR